MSQTYSSHHFHLESSDCVSVQAKSWGLTDITLPQWLYTCRKAAWIWHEEVLSVLLSSVRMWTKVFSNEGSRGFLYHMNFIIRSPELSPEFPPTDTCRQGHRTEVRPGGGCICISCASRHVSKVCRITWTESRRSSQKTPQNIIIPCLSKTGRPLGPWNFRSM